MPPDLGGIETEATGEAVDEDLPDEVRLGLAVAAVRADRSLVRDCHPPLGERVLDVVRAGEHVAREHRRPEGRVERAAVDDVRVPHTDDAAVVRGRDLGVVNGLARVSRRAEVLRTVLDPLHGPSEIDCVKAGEDVLRIDAELQPEAAAEVGGDDPDVGLREAQSQRELAAMEVWHLSRRANVESTQPWRVVGDDPRVPPWEVL